MADKQGGPDLAEEAFRLHFRQIYRYLLRKTGSAHEAEELAQRVFVDAAATLDPGNPPKSLLAWLYVVAERRFVDEIRRRARAEQVVARLEPARSEELEYGPAISRALADAVARLNPESQRVVVMKLFEGRSFQEIAGRLGSTEDACKMRFSRAIRRLRDELQREGHAP